MAEPRWEWDHRAQRLEHLRRRTRECRSREDARLYRHDADTFTREIAGDGQSHSYNGGFRRGIRRLTHLTFAGGGGGGIHQHPTLTVDRLERHHACSRARDAAECANGIEA